MANQLVKIFKALSDKTRLDIVKDLLKSKEFACAEFRKKLPKSQPTLSHHFNKLIDASIISERKEGANSYYSINRAFLKSIGIDIKKIVKKADSK